MSGQEDASTMNSIPQDLLSNLLNNLNTAAEERLDEEDGENSNESSEEDELDENDELDEDDNNDDYDYIDNLEDDFDINLMDEVDYKEILSQFFETKDGDNIADVLSAVKYSIDQNSKCIMKLCKVIESFQSVPKSEPPKMSKSPVDKKKANNSK